MRLTRIVGTPRARITRRVLDAARHQGVLCPRINTVGMTTRTIHAGCRFLSMLASVLTRCRCVGTVLIRLSTAQAHPIFMQSLEVGDKWHVSVPTPTDFRREYPGRVGMRVRLTRIEISNGTTLPPVIGHRATRL